jgi:hypothetical protein
MTIIAHLTVSQAATLINACIALIHHTTGVALVVILVYVMRNTNSAISWSSVAGQLHSSIWPTILRADSASSTVSDSRIRFISLLGIVGTILLTVAGVITPLGLKSGPLTLSDYSFTSAAYVPDTSPLGLATPSRDYYTYGRICGAVVPVTCPGSDPNVNTSTIAPYIIDQFGIPFHMQFRLYFRGQVDNYPMTLSTISLTESLILRGGIFAVGGLIVDFTSTPGIGLWNHTIPDIKLGGTWSEDVLWLEPVTSCVNTNITLDYGSNPNIDLPTGNLTDRGGFADLTTQYPEYSRDGQNIDLYAHAYKGAVLSNYFIMQSLGNLTRNETYVGKVFPFYFATSSLITGKMQVHSLDDLSIDNSNAKNTTFPKTEDRDLQTLCEGYGGTDTANITNVAVHCNYIIAPPQRSDGGDPNLPDTNTNWTQTIHVCASATRARIQTITFSFNGTRSLDDLTITRQNTNVPLPWAMENSDLNIADVDLYWGWVADSYENDSSLSMTRSEVFYIPAGGSDVSGVVTAGQPNTVPGGSWGAIASQLFDYSGANNFALLNKWQVAMQNDAALGAAQIINSIWTDLAANNLMGNDTDPVPSTAEYIETVAFDFLYGIPAFILLLVWLPTFLVAVFALASGGVELEYLRFLLNQTSVGRIVVGDSELKVVTDSTPIVGSSLDSVSSLHMDMATSVTPSAVSPTTPATISSPRSGGLRDIGTAEWAESAGRTLLAIGGSQTRNGEGGWLLNPSDSDGDEEKKLGVGDHILRKRRLTSVLADVSR